ncbi:ABC transporter substrate-binding protein [Chloroflexota bacterium]
MKKLSIVISLLLVLALLLSCAPKPASTPGPAPTPPPVPQAPSGPTGELTLALTDWGNDTFAPATAQGQNRIAWDLIFNYLMVFNADRKLEPSLATKWEMSPDGKTWTISLRNDVKFQNGDPLTAEDVKYSIEDAIIPESISTGGPMIRESLESMEVTDPYTLVLHMNKPTMKSAIITPLARYIPIVPKSYRESVGRDEFERKPIGTGPFNLVGHVIGDSFKFEAWDGYWGPAPAFKTLTVKYVPEEATRIAMLKTGEADIVNIEISSKQEVQSAGFKIAAAKGMFNSNVNFLGQYYPDSPGYDSDNPFLDVRVRQALTLAINREELAEQIFLGQAVPSGNWPFMPGLEGWDDKWTPRPYDLEKAKQLMAEAGYPNGFKTKMYIYKTSGMPDLPKMTEAITMYWAELGVQAELEQTKWSAVKPSLKAEEVSGHTILRRGDAQDDCLSRMNTEVSSWGITRAFETAETDALIKEIGATLDDTTRANLSKQLGQILYDQYATAPLVRVDTLYAVSGKIGDWQLLPFASVLNLQSLSHP